VNTHPRLALQAAPVVILGEARHALALPDALLLAWLSLEGATSRERLAALLWPDSTAEAARSALRQRLSRLRRQCGEGLLADSGTLLALAEGVAHDLDAGTPLLGSLTAPALPELDAWLARHRAGRSAARRVQLAERIQGLEAAGDAGAALPLALELLDADPLSEDAHRRVMRLHYLRGDRAAAMLAFDRCEQLLKHEVGAAPSAETLALLATIERAVPLAGAAPQRQPVPAALLRPPRLVGREAERLALAQGLAAGHGVVLVGEAGMGKSRLLQSLAAEEPRLLHASGRPGDSLVPYATLTRALRAVLEAAPDVADASGAALLAPLLPELARAGREAASAPSLAPTPLLRPVRALLQRAARRPGAQQPAAVEGLLLDDLHFADTATLELLQGLLAAPRDDPEGPLAMRVVLGLRPPAPDSALAALLAALAAAGPQVRLVLQPLTVAALAELVDALALPGLVGAAVAERLHARTGGNPLFALETLKLLWAEGSGHVDGAALPRAQTLAQLIGQQLARLSPSALQLARVAAVAGVDFSLELAEALTGSPALALADPWAELEAQQVMRGTAFSHDLVHDAVLQGLPEVIARHLHGRTAAFLEAAPAALPGATALPGPGAGVAPSPARVAAHWEAAGQRARALPALRAAAEQARQALRMGERIALLEHAAGIAEAEGRLDEAFDLVHAAIDGHMNGLRQHAGLPLLERHARLARTPLQHARATANRAWYAAVLGRWDEALAHGRTALALAQPLGDTRLTASVQQRLGAAMGMAGHFEDALAHLHAAEAWMRTEAAPEHRVEFEGNFAAVLDNLGRHAEAREHHARAIADAALHAEPPHRASLLANDALSRLDAGDAAGALEQALMAQRIVQQADASAGTDGFIAVLLAQAERGLGRYTPALAWCERAEAILAERVPARVPVARMHQAHVWLDLAQHARARQLLAGDGVALARQLPPRYGVRWRVLLARLARRLDAPAEARDWLAEAQAALPAAGWPELALIVRTEQALGLDEPAEAVAVLAEVAAEAARLGLAGAELGARLQLAWRATDETEAVENAEQALTLSRHAEALHTDRAWRWLAPARALQRAGRTREAEALAQEGREWLRHTAATQVPPACADSFIHQHPVHRLLRAPLA
jgi:DNA-binding SARP family transcriptional activator/tetratricopeptide (TPR) repeat protein